MTSIYALLDPNTAEVRYVGKSVNPALRYASHIHSRLHPRTHCGKWIRSLAIKGHRPEMVILEDSADWHEAEPFWISYFKFLGARLTNHSTGGEMGPIGYTPSHEARTKMSSSQRRRVSEAKKYPLLHQGLFRFMYAKPVPMSAESRHKLSNSMRAYYRNPANRLRVSEQVKARHAQGLYSYDHLKKDNSTDKGKQQNVATKRSKAGWGKLGFKGVTRIPNSNCYSALAPQQGLR
jgi:hypothetical protein